MISGLLTSGIAVAYASAKHCLGDFPVYTVEYVGANSDSSTTQTPSYAVAVRSGP
jgi:hypothetical protein